MNRRDGLELVDPGMHVLRSHGDAHHPSDIDAHPFKCKWCRTLTERTTWSSVQHCPSCRSIYGGAAKRFLCRLPVPWSVEAFARFWERGMVAAADADDDLAFSRFLCRGLGFDFEPARAMVGQCLPAPTLVGEVTLAHRMLSQRELQWILNFQRTMKPHRRRCFGEIGVILGLWTDEALPPLLAVQAERTRGLADALARRFNIAAARVLEAEREFFGLGAAHLQGGRPSPLHDLMVA